MTLAPNVLSMAAPKAATTLAPVAQSLAQQQPGPMQPVRSPYNSPMPAPKPNALGGAFKSFAQGFLGPEKIGALDKMQSDKQAEVGKRALAWIQQTAQLPPQARAQFTLQNAQRIAADTGQPVEAVMQSAQDPNAFSDEAMQQAIAQFSAQLGQGPEQPEYMNLGGGNVGKVAGGKFSMAHEAPPDPTNTKLTTEIGANGNYWTFDTASGAMKDTGVKAPPKQGSQANLQTKVGSNGNYWTFDPNSGKMADTGVPAPAKGGNGIQLEFDENGGISGLSIGGTGTKGNEPALVRSPEDGQTVVTPGKQQLNTNKAWNALQEYEAQNQTIVEDIDRALNLSGPLTTGLIGQIFQGVGGMPAHDLQEVVNTIKSNIGFEKLQQMRNDSPTGGALGAVSDTEQRLLQSVLGSLATSQSEKQLRYNLGRLKNILGDKEGRRKKAFAQDYPKLAEYAGFAKGAAAEGNALQSMSEEDLRKRLAQLKGGQ